jgi:hypothetical protein
LLLFRLRKEIWQIDTISELQLVLLRLSAMISSNTDLKMCRIEDLLLIRQCLAANRNMKSRRSAP